VVVGASWAIAVVVASASPPTDAKSNLIIVLPFLMIFRTEDFRVLKCGYSL
jgi:hypothetical protein